LDFETTEEQKMIRQVAREFAETKVKPIAGEIDRTARWPTETVQGLADLGLLGMMVPSEYGGAGADYVSYVGVVEELSRVCASTGVILSVNNSLFGYPVRTFGTPEQKEKYLRPIGEGKKLGSYALSEPGAGSDAGSLKTTARLEGDTYVLNGTKHFITNGPASDFVVVYANEDPSKRHRGISAFIVEKSFKGFEVGSEEDKLGIRASGSCEMVFQDCEVPKENLLGPSGEGFKVALKTLDAGRIGIAAQAVGIAQGSLDIAVEYAKARQQFGKPLASFQAIQWKVADMATGIEAARHLMHRAAWMKDQGVDHNKEASIAKLLASQVAMRASNDAVQILGGVGYTKDYPAERFYRDAKVTEIYEGTSEIQRVVISRAALR
jgi:alkylation response protein AidB-like acyl-CoA dehydrogenase